MGPCLGGAQGQARKATDVHRNRCVHGDHFIPSCRAPRPGRSSFQKTILPAYRKMGSHSVSRCNFGDSANYLSVTIARAITAEPPQKSQPIDVFLMLFIKEQPKTTGERDISFADARGDPDGNKKHRV